MRFQKGVRFPYYRRPRGPGRRNKPGGRYRMSRAAYQARIHNASKARAALARRQGKPERTYEETRSLELEIALARHRGETYRAIARRLGCSHVHCWRVARDYCRGLIPMLPCDQQGLVAMCDSLSLVPPHSLAEAGAPTRDSDGAPVPPHRAPPEPARHLYEVEGGESRWMTAAEYNDYCIAEMWRKAGGKQCEHPSYGNGQRVAFSVPIPRGAWSRG